jgi:hypothetical protein
MFDRAVDVFGWDRGVWESWDTHAMRDLIALWKRIGDPPDSATTAEANPRDGADIPTSPTSSLQVGSVWWASLGHVSARSRLRG